MTDDDEVPTAALQHFQALFGDECVDFKPHFGHNPTLDTLTYWAAQPIGPTYEHGVSGTNLVLIRVQGTDQIVGLTIGRYSEAEHYRSSGEPN